MLIYVLSIKKASVKASASIKKSLYERSINGTVYLNNRQHLHCTEFLEITSYPAKQPESIQLCPCKSTAFEQFVSDGDSIVKRENTLSALFIKPDGTRKTFELPLCE